MHLPTTVVAMHDCEPSGPGKPCPVCWTAYMRRSNQKWQALQEHWRQKREYMNSQHIDASLVAAVFTKTDAEKQEELLCRQ